MKLLRTCFVSSFARELAKLMKEQYSAAQAHHFSWKIKLHTPSETFTSLETQSDIKVSFQIHLSGLPRNNARLYWT